MYIYELARDLGAEPRELIERAAVEGLGHLSPNSLLAPDQAAAADHVGERVTMAVIRGRDRLNLEVTVGERPSRRA